MKVLPIIFSGPMVRAMWDDRKSQTRRILKPQPNWVASSGRWAWPLPKRALFPGCCTHVCSASREWHEYAPKAAWPFSVGDLLYVREMFMTSIDAGGGLWRYAADYDADGVAGMRELQPWRPSIHMPRQASRMALRVTDLRVQQLQDIGEEDAKAEGISIDALDSHHRERFDRMKTWPELYRPMFSLYWDSLNAQRGRAWVANPWVIALTFEVIKANVDDYLREAA